jgi:hypothetical protein
MKKIILIGGGTFSHVRSHLSLAAPAFGTTVNILETMFNHVNTDMDYFNNKMYEALQHTSALSRAPNLRSVVHVVKYLTKMADPISSIVTNEDVSDLIDKLLLDTDVKVIVFNPALVDYDGQTGMCESNKHARRLETKDGNTVINITPSKKIIGKIRKDRKDIFVVGFKTTCNESSDVQYLKGLELLKKNSLNLVVANDTVTHNNMIIAPEETRYCETKDRMELLTFLVKMIEYRSTNTFTRSTVIPGEAIDWNGELVSSTLREVVNHCIKEGAYKEFLGKTAGHFATKIGDNEILTSIRKTNYNHLDEIGLVKIESKNTDEVIAHGFKPSVGGQSQRIIFKEHPEMDSIVHFHCPVKEGVEVSTRPQWQNSCGSFQCGQNTSDGLCEINLGDGDKLKVVYLDNHGPNIVFNSRINPKKVIDYIDQTFDLKSKTGGMVA